LVAGARSRVHAGPSVDTPITQFYALGTPLNARRYWNDWIEVVEPGTSKSGWIYRKYLGAISNRARSRLKRRKSKGLLRSVLQSSVTRKPFQLNVTRTPLALPRDQLMSVQSRRHPSAAAPKWQACCSGHSAATEVHVLEDVRLSALTRPPIFLQDLSPTPRMRSASPRLSSVLSCYP